MIRIQNTPIRVEVVVGSVTTVASGAINAFIGTTRNHSRGRAVKLLEYEVYEPMALRMMERIIQEAKSRWDIHDTAIVHRVGRVNVGEASVVIAVSSAHRDEAFEACRFLIDRLKQVVPIWKREFFEDGTIEWSPQSHDQKTEMEIQ
ncbi:MAG TPA: molybdenum cofactor biosynthesis protein MoaE [Bacteroidota bacterium]|nr:molybdenum cofactor biosynthesis protein MoaE [Bacteroidota bacterium]